MSGAIAEGEHLRQQEIALRWGVSQTPARDGESVAAGEGEAFRRLESEGLVAYEENRGVIVRGIPWTPPPSPIETLARRWNELVTDPDAVPGSDFP